MASGAMASRAKASVARASEKRARASKARAKRVPLLLLLVGLVNLGKRGEKVTSPSGQKTLAPKQRVYRFCFPKHFAMKIKQMAQVRVNKTTLC